MSGAETPTERAAREARLLRPELELLADALEIVRAVAERRPLNVDRARSLMARLMAFGPRG